jgi:hypothetical protein
MQYVVSELHIISNVIKITTSVSSVFVAISLRFNEHFSVPLRDNRPFSSPVHLFVLSGHASYSVRNGACFCGEKAVGI